MESTKHTIKLAKTEVISSNKGCLITERSILVSVLNTDHRAKRLVLRFLSVFKSTTAKSTDQKADLKRTLTSA